MQLIYILSHSYKTCIELPLFHAQKSSAVFVAKLIYNEIIMIICNTALLVLGPPIIEYNEVFIISSSGQANKVKWLLQNPGLMVLCSSHSPTTVCYFSMLVGLLPDFKTVIT